MSADNYINIYRCPDGRYRGYMGFESDRCFGSEEDYDHQVLRSGARAMFDVATEKEAWEIAEQEYTEYGIDLFDHPDHPDVISGADI